MEARLWETYVRACVLPRALAHGRMLPALVICSRRGEVDVERVCEYKEKAKLQKVVEVYTADAAQLQELLYL